jgi:hypothetical protein
MDPSDVAVSSSGSSLYISDATNHVLRHVDMSTGIITTVAGIPTVAAYTGDGASL